MPSNFIAQIIQQLLVATQDPQHAEQEAWWLLEAITNKSRTDLLARNYRITQEEQAQLAHAIKQRVVNHKPLQYILGDVPFCGLTMRIRPPILIPRPETEEWVTWLIEGYQKAAITTFTALDLCTGSGCIALALAKHFPHATILGVDINPEAIKLADENKQANNLNNVTFLTSDLYENLPTDVSCNLIVSNPPYLAPEEYQQLEADVRNWEDERAFVGGSDGMIFYHRILSQAAQWLQPSMAKKLPQVVMEIGPAQEEHLEPLLKQLNITAYIIHRDLQGRQRWISLSLSS